MNTNQHDSTYFTARENNRTQQKEQLQHLLYLNVILCNVNTLRDMSKCVGFWIRQRSIMTFNLIGLQPNTAQFSTEPLDVSVCSVYSSACVSWLSPSAVDQDLHSITLTHEEQAEHHTVSTTKLAMQIWWIENVRGSI